MKISKDTKLNKLLNSRKLYLVILGLIVIYVFIDDKILNEPNSFVIARWTLSTAIVLTFCYSRFAKFKEYYLKLMKSATTVSFSVILISLSIIIFQAVFSIPVDLLIKFYARDSQVEYQKCPINNVVTTGIDKVHFIFLNKTYSQYFETNGHTRKELISNYYLLVGVKKSIGDSYCLESLKLLEK